MSTGEKGLPRSRLDNPLLAAESSKRCSKGSSSFERLLSTSSVASDKDGDTENMQLKMASQQSRDSSRMCKPSSMALTTSSKLVGIGTGRRDLTGDSGRSLQFTGSNSLLGKSSSLSSGSSLKSSSLSQTPSCLKVSQLKGGSLTFSSVKSSMSLFTGGSIQGNLSSSKLASSSLLQSSALSHSSLLTSSTLKLSSGPKLTTTPITPRPSKNKPNEIQRTVDSEEASPLPDTKGFSQPTYDFSREFLEATQVLPLSETLGGFTDESSEVVVAGLVDVAALKHSLINFVSASLISAPNFQEPSDPTRASLMSLCHQVIQYDAEFVLKVALYTRCELNIRTTANFLLAVSSNSPQCRPFLRKYYSASIRLPSDWIDVAELYQAFHDKSLNFGSLPTALRKAMIAKFPEFDAYQLAKYNKEKKKNPVKKDGKQRKPDSYAVKSVLDSQVSKESVSSHVTDDEDHHTEEELIHLSFTLKQLIRKLHIKEPVEHVLCLIGKKYPDDLESFYESKLPGTFDETRAGKRMKLPTPETWETQVSLKGNKASTWEELIG
jgi:telomerase protein component 1